MDDQLAAHLEILDGGNVFILARYAEVELPVSDAIMEAINSSRRLL